MPSKENPRTHRGRSEERRRQAWAMYLAGETSRRAIARALGISHTQVQRYINTTLAEVQAETKAMAEQVREVELQRLDTQLRNLWPQVLRGNLKAHEVALRVADRRSRLLGLDAPQRIEESGPGGRPPVLYIEIARLPPRELPGGDEVIEGEGREVGSGRTGDRG